MNFDNLYLATTDGSRFLIDDVVQDVYRNPTVVQVRYKNKDQSFSKRKNNSSVSSQFALSVKWFDNKLDLWLNNKDGSNCSIVHPAKVPRSQGPNECSAGVSDYWIKITRFPFIAESSIEAFILKPY